MSLSLSRHLPDGPANPEFIDYLKGREREPKIYRFHLKAIGWASFPRLLTSVTMMVSFSSLPVRLCLLTII